MRLYPYNGPDVPPGNGVLDQCDTCAWRPCYGTCCPADYDGDGGVTGGDLSAFFDDYEQGLDCSDVDEDGGITGADLSAFFSVYEAGGC